MDRWLKLAAYAACVLCINTSSVIAKDFGRYAPLWEIAEPSILETIYARLGDMEDSGELAEMQEDMQDTTRAYVNRPRPVIGLTNAKEYRQFNVDLSIVLSRSLQDHKGNVFAKKGTIINPLHYSRFNKRIIIFDGDNEEQVEFAISAGNELNILLVLTNGAPLELMRQHQRRFYFDQDAQMVKKFNIEKLPSVISRGDDVMIVEEIPMELSNEG
jgi:conjugal transfer pilus assembly protein TraW